MTLDWMSKGSLQSIVAFFPALLLACSKSSLTSVTSVVASNTRVFFPLIGNYIVEHIHQLFYSFDVFFNASWSQLLMDVGLG